MSQHKMTKEELENLIPVFKMKLLSSTSAMCKYIGCVKKEENIYDEPMELTNENGKSEVVYKDLGTYGSYYITAKTFICSIIGSYLIKSVKLPTYFMSLFYDKKFVSGYLFVIYLYFTIDSCHTEELKNPSNYVNKNIKGKLTLELVSDEDFLTNFLKKRETELEREYMIEYIDQFERSNHNEKITIMNEIKQKVQNKLNMYSNLFEPIEIVFIGKKSIIKKMYEIYENPLMNDLIKFGLEMRENERLKKSGHGETYKVPNKIIKLKELKEHPESIDQKIDEILQEDNVDDIDDNND